MEALQGLETIDLKTTMKRATSLRNGSGRRQSRETYVGGAFLLVLAVMGLIALSRIPHGPANAPDPHSDLSSAHSSQHEKRELTQLERGSAGISLSSRSAFTSAHISSCLNSFIAQENQYYLLICTRGLNVVLIS